MCGIAGVHFKKPGSMNGPQLERFVNQLLIGIEHRGTDATGVVSVAPGGMRVTLSKEAKKASEFIKERPSLGDGEIRTVLLHTRMATQGHQRNNANNHPVLHGTTFVTHNGHISNDDEIFQEIVTQRVGQVDSEAIAALIEQEGFEKVNVALQKLLGGFAIAAVNPIAYPDQLILAKGHSNPLVFFENGELIVWASTVEAIMDAWGATIGTPPNISKFRQLAAGQIYMFNGPDGEVFEFKPAEYPTNQSWSHFGVYTGGYQRLTDEERNDICYCGHRRFWHTGISYNGDCMDKVHGEECRCSDFLSSNPPNAVEKCDGCSVWTLSAEMGIVAENYILCQECNDEYGEYFKTSYEADAVTETAGVDPPAKHLELVSGPTLEETRRWHPLMEGNDLIRHNFILGKVSTETGFNVSFIEWILFRSEVEVVDADAWLTTAHEECDEAYATVEEELNAIEDEIGMEEMVKQVILH